MKEVEGTPEMFSVTYEGLIDDVDAGSRILLDDGLIGLEVEKIDKEKGHIHVKVLNSGTLKNKKGVNVPGVSVNLPGITEKDASDILFGINKTLILLRHHLFVERQMFLKSEDYLKKIMRHIFKSFLKSKIKKV